MNMLADEFQKVIQIYKKLGQDLSRTLCVPESRNCQTLIQSILSNRQCLSEIEKMNARIAPLSKKWIDCRANLDPKSREEISKLVETAKKEAMQLNQLCSANIEKIAKAKEDMRARLKEIDKGAQFLKSMKPIKNNYPKFIDSRC
jgi:hypothetical protein